MADAPASSRRRIESMERDSGLADATIGFFNFIPRYVV